MEVAIKLANIPIDDMKKMKEDMTRCIVVDWKDVWKSMMNLIQLDFLEGMRAVWTIF